ncbi:MAG: DUF4317 domain-containing protein [Lachnospiraceae bacterium]|nr:DUF4317 domain-containing protein [Lachnospiraceae bacterium]
MNRKEVNEIKKLYTLEDSPISRICGCFVDTDKNKKVDEKNAFVMLEDEAKHKYFDIFKKTLSGAIGRNLINMSFPTDKESEEGSAFNMLMKLRDSELTDSDLIEQFYDRIIENFDYPDNYYIILIHNNYDIPAITKDGMSLEDASDEVYQYIICAICPIKPSKPGLTYNAHTNSIENCVRSMMVEAPMLGFTFPAFNDRSSDVHNILYYTKNAKDISSAITETVLELVPPYTAGTQKDLFNEIIEESYGKDCGFDKIKSLHTNLNDLMAEKKDDPEPLILDKTEVKHLLANSGAKKENIETFEAEYDESISKDTPILASNIANTKKFEVKMPDVTIQVSPDRTELINTKLIDGVPYLLIQVTDAVVVNGISCHPLSGVEEL